MKKHEFNINEKVNPLLSNVWGQWYPFNTHCPSNVFPFFAKNKNNAPTGCVAMALAQIMAFHEFPQKIEITDFDWQKIKQIMPCENPNFFGEKKYINALTKFLAEIGKKCLNIYAHNWTFALPQMAKRCLKYFGYQNVTLTYGLCEKRIIYSLEKNCPVFVAAISGLLNGHAWVIDGYAEITDNEENMQILFHCNFGWNGRANGWYFSKYFNTKIGAPFVEEYENAFERTTTENFTWAFHVITCEKPLNR